MLKKFTIYNIKMFKQVYYIKMLKKFTIYNIKMFKKVYYIKMLKKFTIYCFFFFFLKCIRNVCICHVQKYNVFLPQNVQEFFLQGIIHVTDIYV